MIDYSKLNIYFHLEDEITNDIFESITAGIRSKDIDVYTTMNEELDALIKTNDSVDTVLPDAHYSIQIYQILFSHAYKAKLDITMYLFSIFYRHDFKNFLPDIIKEYLNTIHITQVTYGNTHDKLTQYDNDLAIKVYHHMVKLVTNQTKCVKDIQLIAQYGLNNIEPLLKDNDIEKHATIKTLATFGGTVTQARELVNRYLFEVEVTKEAV